MPNPPKRPETTAFGRESRKLRRSLPLRPTQEEIGELVNVGRSYISQIENGSAQCREDFAMRLGKVLDGITDPRHTGEGTRLHKAWLKYIKPLKLQEDEHRFPQEYRNYPRAESSAVMARCYVTKVVNGLFQTEAYASAMLNSPEDVKARMDRKRIFERTPLPQVSMIMDEAVLYTRVGSDKVMYDQITELMEMIDKGLAIIQVLRPVYIPHLRTDFAIASQADGRQMIYCPYQTGGVTSTDPARVAECAAIWVKIQAEALSPRESYDFMGKVRDELYGPS